MIVSERRQGSPAAVEGLSWLQQQLAWEKTLDRLRRAAGVEGLVPEPAGEERAAA